MNYHYEKDNWVNPNISYVINKSIFEYDIQSAGLSMLKQFGNLSKQQIIQLENMDKHSRVIAIGNLQKDPNVNEIIKNGFIQSRKMFILENNININNIIAVKKDAIFHIGNVNKLNFGYINFIKKNEYSSYVKFLNEIEFYYNYSHSDIKGIGEYNEKIHSLYLTKIINELIHLLEINDNKYKRKLMSFISKYKAKELSPEYYIPYGNSKDDNIYNLINILIPLIYLGNRLD